MYFTDANVIQCDVIGRRDQNNKCQSCLCVCALMSRCVLNPFEMISSIVQYLSSEMERNEKAKDRIRIRGFKHSTKT